MISHQEDQNTISTKRSHSFLTAIKSVFATIGVISVVLFVIFVGIISISIYSFSSGIKTFSSSMGGASSSAKTGLTFTTPNTSSPYIAGIRLYGEITPENSALVIEKLETARDDKHVVGILFDVNSPGGSVVPSQEIYDTIKEITKIKPVVTYVREVAASGAYYSSASSSKIIANRGSIIGSIGVIMNGFEADKLIQFLKINPFVIKTGALKDTGSPTRPMNEKDKQYLQELIEETRMQFVDDVKQGRKTSDATMKFMSDGRVVLGPQELNLKLIDIIGTKQTAISELVTLAKVKTTPDVFYYDDIQTFSELFAQKFAGSTSNIIRDSFSENFKNTKLQNKIPKAEY